jgi:pimeloyl-ACP methyl ester carboxylesterase
MGSVLQTTAALGWKHEQIAAGAHTLVYAFVERTQNWDDASIYSRTAGNGPPVLLVHSLGGTSEHWRFTMPFLAQQGFEATALDLPGHGASGIPAGELSPRWMGAALARSLQQPTLLVGNSLGGWVALRAYLERPQMVLGICLVAAAGLEGMPTRPEKLTLGPSGVDLVGGLLATAFYRPEALSEEVRGSFWRGVIAPALLRLSPQGLLDSAALARVRCPVLIAWGTEDRILPVSWAEKFARSLPLHKLAVLPDCGHLPQLECPDAFHHELLPFAEVFRPRMDGSGRV